mgnify:CR=1 FL=1
MKRTLIILLASILLAGCAANFHVQKSEHVVTTIDRSVIYIKEGDVGNTLYKHYMEGEWGDDYIVVMLDSIQFKQLYEKSYISKRRN